MQQKTTQNDVYRRLKPWQRLEAAATLYWFAREIIKKREQRLHPELNADELEKRVRSFF